MIELTNITYFANCFWWEKKKLLFIVKDVKWWMASNHFHLNLQIILYLYSKFYCFLGGSRIYHIKVSLVSSHFHVNLQIILFIETVNKIHHIRVVVPAYLFSQSAFQRKDLTFLIHCHFAFRCHLFPTTSSLYLKSSLQLWS